MHHAPGCPRGVRPGPLAQRGASWADGVPTPLGDIEQRSAAERRTTVNIVWGIVGILLIVVLLKMLGVV
jgi:hypothetical protein